MSWHGNCIYFSSSDDAEEDVMKRLIKKLEDIMVAITFAEAGEFDEANKTLGSDIVDIEETTQALSGIGRKTALESVNK